MPPLVVAGTRPPHKACGFYRAQSGLRNGPDKEAASLFVLLLHMRKSRAHPEPPKYNHAAKLVIEPPGVSWINVKKYHMLFKCMALHQHVQMSQCDGDQG